MKFSPKTLAQVAGIALFTTVTTGCSSDGKQIGIFTGGAIKVKRLACETLDSDSKLCKVKLPIEADKIGESVEYLLAPKPPVVPQPPEHVVGEDAPTDVVVPSLPDVLPNVPVVLPDIALPPYLHNVR